MRLHGYYRSTAAWRVRIALNLKNVAAEHIAVHLRRGAQREPPYRALNPLGLVPALEVDGQGVLTQSLAICEWLDETVPSPPLLPGTPWPRAQARQFAMTIACDTHPVQNLRVLSRLRQSGLDEAAVTGWARWAIGEGLAACEAMLAARASRADTRFCFADTPGLAELCLVPQLYNARRFGQDVAMFPLLLDIEARCRALAAFADADPARQSDAEPP